MHVQWKTVRSTPFSLQNGEKHGVVFSNFILFYIYSLIQNLQASGLGCHVDRNFAGALGKADDPYFAIAQWAAPDGSN